MKRKDQLLFVSARGNVPVIGYKGEPLLNDGITTDVIDTWTNDSLLSTLVNYHTKSQLDHSTSTATLNKVVSWHNININNTFPKGGWPC